MIEIKNVTKTYKSKGGVETKALDGVSITFGETGLVFLLGKSGSGKSTLLNVCGGLDAPTDGEIIVKGKSSKEFSASDFDSYRNTFVGFVFQEYNILDEFNVEDNIALALELQGKPKDRDKIYSILKEVELEAYAKRKPNTLSGGQKQRIAIARALVKEPQIIMADEPTGALDSATGKQVFETLKELSKTRLVMVVSHDREFAEIYGDRIVELKDGKIISDVSKVNVPPAEVDENLCLIGENTLSVKSGSSLSAKNIKTIKDFILSSGEDVIITKGETQITAFRKANRIASDNSAESFADTSADSVPIKAYTEEDGRFIRSRLPAAKAVKIGATGLKLKPIRLVFTILLSVVAFVMFGLFSTLMVYDGVKVAAKSFAESDTEYFNLGKRYTYKYDADSNWNNSAEAAFTPDEYEYFKREFSKDSICYYKSDSVVENVRTNSMYYQSNITGYAYIPENHVMRGKIIYGSYPVNDDEICISSYYLDVLINSDFYTLKEDGQGNATMEKTEISSASDAIGKYINCNLTGGDIRVMKIKGVFDSGKISADYEKLKSKTVDDYLLHAKFSYLLAENLHQFVLVSETYHEAHKLEAEKFVKYYKGQFLYEGICFNGVQSYEKVAFPVIFTDGEKTELADDEIIISVEMLAFSKLYEEYKEFKRNEIYSRLTEENPELSEEDLTYLTENELIGCLSEFDRYIIALSGAKVPDGDYSAEYLKKAEAAVKEFIDYKGGITISVDHKYYGNTNITENYTFKVAGFYTDYYDGKTDNILGCYVSENFFETHLKAISGFDDYITNYKPTGEEKYSGIIIPYDGTEQTFKRLSKLLGEDNRNENDVYYELNSYLYMCVDQANVFAHTLRNVFLGAGIAFAVFAGLLMFNFISVSISNKRKEIGILRAVGARGADVFKIFFSEAGIITVICTALAIIGTATACFLLNGVTKELFDVSISMFVFGFASVGMMLAIAALVAFAATFFPVFFAARKKPVESIRSL